LPASSITAPPSGEAEVRPSLPSLSRVVRAPVAASPVAASPVAASPVAASPVAASPVVAPPVAGDVEWLVSLPGKNEPVRVYAPDIVQAITAAGRVVPADLLRLASVWRADEPS
jgi:hypothetical protein